MNNLFYCIIEQIVLFYLRVMLMKLSKLEETAFRSAGEPRQEPDYMTAAAALLQTLPPVQAEQLAAILSDFGELVRFERRWYFHKGWLAARRKPPED